MGNESEAREESRPVAVVTGAARGIGRAIVVELSRHGYDVAGIDVAWGDEGSSESARSLEKEIATHGAKLFPLAGDIAELAEHSELVDSIMGSMGRIDLLVNNAGVAPVDRRDILEMTPQSFDRVLGINLRGTFFFTQRVVRQMISTRAVLPDRRMSVIFITSISADVSSLNRAEYCVSKSGLSMAARVFADRLASEGIGVYEVRPGIILTAMTKPVKEKYDRMIAGGLVPQGRWGNPEDVARAVAALACGEFDYSTGAVIEVSGGMNLRRL
jgi:NAD(P)-dependent dehydrogenase (short-subunit alcohol dehydrogenase family)